MIYSAVHSGCPLIYGIKNGNYDHFCIDYVKKSQQIFNYLLVANQWIKESSQMFVHKCDLDKHKMQSMQGILRER